MRRNSIWIGAIAIICGILVLAIPEVLRILVGIFLIGFGVIAIFRRW